MSHLEFVSKVLVHQIEHLDKTTSLAVTIEAIDRLFLVVQELCKVHDGLVNTIKVRCAIRAMLVESILVRPCEERWFVAFLNLIFEGRIGCNLSAIDEHEINDVSKGR